ncbi:hypothetical protein RB595_002827 [Gaeumannomyces hyphopodioides]
MFKFFDSFMFNFELTRLLGSMPAGGCDACEFLTAVGKIKKHDPEPWHDAWKEQGERAEAIADEAAGDGLRALAKNAYLRASNYYRVASYLFFNEDPRVVPLSERSVAAFVRATTLMDGVVLLVQIPEARLPGKIPLLLYFGGADSTKEELHFLFGHSGPQLGYAVLCVEGPGQGLLLKRSGIPLRPDFEVCADKALGFLEDLSRSRPELQLDLDRIAVAGAATGGYFALRAATDARIKACVSIDPFFSMWELAMTRVPQPYLKLWESGWITDTFFDWFARLGARTSFLTQWEQALGISSMGVNSASAMMRRFKDFSLDKGKVLELITRPVLLTGPGAGREMYSSAEDGAIKIHKLLTRVAECNKELWVPMHEADGGLTAKIGAWPLLAQRSFQFLDKHFNVDRKKSLEMK